MDTPHKRVIYVSFSWKIRSECTEVSNQFLPHTYTVNFLEKGALCTGAWELILKLALNNYSVHEGRINFLGILDYNVLKSVISSFHTHTHTLTFLEKGALCTNVG